MGFGIAARATSMAFNSFSCQSAFKFDPVSASNFDPLWNVDVHCVPNSGHRYQCSLSPLCANSGQAAPQRLDEKSTDLISYPESGAVRDADWLFAA
jgi:hypothetical protein